VNESDVYVIGGNVSIGPTVASSLLNDYELNVDGTVSARNFVILSDKRFKNVIDNVSDQDSYDKISKLGVIKYKFKDRPDDTREYVGMIAQDVQNVIFDAVDENSSQYVTEDGIIQMDTVYSINYSALVSYLTSALQHTQKKLENAELLLNSFLTRISQLETKVGISDPNDSVNDSVENDSHPIFPGLSINIPIIDLSQETQSVIMN
jgi:hypothetical protein